MNDNKISQLKNNIQINDRVILININKQYKENMIADELYTSTRENWRVDLNRAGKAEYALSTYRGRVLEVYKIDGWEFACIYNGHKRYRFYGNIAPNEIRNKYLGGSVAGYRKRGAQNPILYVNL